MTAWCGDGRRPPRDPFENRQALVTVVATVYLVGVSTRRVERLAKQLGVKSLSCSQVSEMAPHLDAQVKAFRERRLDAGPYTFARADALTVKVREDARVVNAHALIATGVSADGHREILGLDEVWTSPRLNTARDGWPCGVAWSPAGYPACNCSPPMPTPDARRDRRSAAGRDRAALPQSRPAQPTHQGPQIRPAPRRHPGPHHLRPSRCRRGTHPVRPRCRRPRREIPRGRRAPRSRPG